MFDETKIQLLITVLSILDIERDVELREKIKVELAKTFGI